MATSAAASESSAADPARQPAVVLLQQRAVSSCSLNSVERGEYGSVKDTERHAASDSVGGGRGWAPRVLMVPAVCVAVCGGGLWLLLALCLSHNQSTGFACHDASIHKPRLPDTVTSAACVGIAMLLDVSAIALVDTMNVLLVVRRGVRARRWLVGYLLQSARLVLLVVSGVIIVMAVTEIGKRTVGELRPHFIAVCYRNQSTFYQLCPGAPQSPLYVDDARCDGDPAEVEEARMSFPSGHSSSILFAALVATFYVQYQTHPALLKKYRAWLLVVQAVYVGVAWWVMLTRVKDYHHHLRDVAAGAAIGAAAAAVLVASTELGHNRVLHVTTSRPSTNYL